MDIPFGEWTPDMPDHSSTNATEAKNVVPGVKGYKSQNSFAVITSDAISSRCRGAISVKANDTTIVGYAGSSTKLYSVGSTTHTDATNAGGDYNLIDASYWKFAKWGNQVIATALQEPPQIITLGGARFADLGGSPPKAKYCAVIGDFVVLAYTDDGTPNPQGMAWSGINDATTWTPNADTQSDTQTLRSNQQNGGGLITGLTGSSEYGIVFQEYSLHHFSYVGSPLIFDFKEIFPGVGTQCPNSITQEGRLIHFLSQDGFVQISDGINMKRIGDQKVDKWFLDDSNSSFPDRVIAASDPKDSLVYWIYPDNNSTQGIPNKYICFNWFLDRWSYGEIDLEWLYTSVSIGYTLEELDSISSSIDALGISLDSQDFRSGLMQLGAYSTDDKKGVLTNTPLSGLVETGEIQAGSPGRSRVFGVRPLAEKGTSTVQIGYRDLISETVTYTTAATPTASTGYADMRNDARYHRFRANTSGTFDDLLGVDVKIEKTGTR